MPLFTLIRAVPFYNGWPQAVKRYCHALLQRKGLHDWVVVYSIQGLAAVHGCLSLFARFKMLSLAFCDDNARSAERWMREAHIHINDLSSVANHTLEIRRSSF